MFAQKNILSSGQTDRIEPPITAGPSEGSAKAEVQQSMIEARIDRLRMLAGISQDTLITADATLRDVVGQHVADDKSVIPEQVTVSETQSKLSEMDLVIDALEFFIRNTRDRVGALSKL